MVATLLLQDLRLLLAEVGAARVLPQTTTDQMVVRAAAVLFIYLRPMVVLALPDRGTLAAKAITLLKVAAGVLELLVVMQLEQQQAPGALGFHLPLQVHLFSILVVEAVAATLERPQAREETAAVEPDKLTARQA
jgi:hypothetical protein